MKVIRPNDVFLTLPEELSDAVLDCVGKRFPATVTAAEAVTELLIVLTEKGHLSLDELSRVLDTTILPAEGDSDG